MSLNALGVYNVGMPETFLENIKQYIGFDEQDHANLRALASHIGPKIHEIVGRFHTVLRADPSARTVLSGGEEQTERQREVLAVWLAELFDGTYDEAYFSRHARIGAAHTRAKTQQHLIFCGIELIWQELERITRASAIPDPNAALRSAHKLLTLELSVVLESYKESYAKDIRQSERSAVEEKLTQAQHLAKIGQLAASLAHEIKNPLAGISGAIQVIRETMPPDDPHHPIIVEILGQIDRLDATVKDLLLYARPTPPRRTEVPLAALVTRVLNVLREEPALQNVRVEYNEPPADSMIHADGRQIEQLMINLLLNAAHASDDGGKIQLGITAVGDGFRLGIKDAGAGMAPDVRGRAFEPFFTTKAKGTGLGLSICRRIVEAHGGTIELDSEVGKGTTVTIHLPRHWDGPGRMRDDDG